MTEFLIIHLRIAFNRVQHNILITKLEHYGIKDLVNRSFYLI